MIKLYQKRFILSKQDFRNYAKTQLKKSKPLLARNKLYKQIDFLLKAAKARKVLIYIPLYYELDLLRFKSKLCKKYQLFTPFMQGQSLKMVKLRLPFIKKRYGVRECYNSKAVFRVDAVIVPVVGVDKNLKRIGHGMGFYDRFFANLAYTPLIIFVQSTALFINKKLCEPFDTQADFYLNPRRKYMKRDKKNDRIIHNRGKLASPFIRISPS